MRRREFLGALGGAAALSLAARAQQAMPVIGFLTSGTANQMSVQLAAFHHGLKETGFTANENVAVEYRYADNHLDRLPALVTELVRLRVAVIFTGGGPAVALAAKAATATVPIVFGPVSDPVRSGLVASLNRPAGNATGISALTIELDAKRLELLHELVPSARVIGVLLNPDRPDMEIQSRDLQAAAGAIGRELVIVKARNEPEIDQAFDALVRQKAGAVVVGADPYFSRQHKQLIGLAARHSLPAVYQWREPVADGGLMSYGPSLADQYRLAGVYTGRILKGEKPADLPVLRPVKFELAINMKTAKALGLTVPLTLQTAADEVIE